MRKFGKILGFTLMEVNLAIFVMATGVLAMVSLYPLAFRENNQSKEDVRGAALANNILNQLTACLSDREADWDRWHGAVSRAVAPFEGNGRGWLVYLKQANSGGTRFMVPVSRSQIISTSRSTFSALAGAYTGSGATWPASSDFVCALVAQWGRKSVPRNRNGDVDEIPDQSRVAISLRCARNARTLFSAPMYYTEVHFQGDQKKQ